ncbi:hypothetical protein GYMLUDRAFT_391868 [Collybiopsis luxurians FD-317 M1]|uniref:FAD/NAD(P)-binding domain-containing protein n=1 Tax=Collybiopsis luxurians FD-317 M1 TaxID=944289 RepID=A0A0D0AN08_9AGAR|nr:hypothetical protein GYMLUDRAFT_391868 [Collybiopsis luxurians FD-317 M1]
MLAKPQSSEIEIFSSWIAQFAKHLEQKDAQSITSLFLSDGWLRDFLVFQWNLRTLHGHEQILAYLSLNLQNPNITTNKTSNPVSNFTVASDEHFKPSPGGLPGSISGGFTFSTPIANGKGMVTLMPDPALTDHETREWKATTVFITLDSLKGHEESGVLRDIYLRKPTWTESRETRWKKTSEDPEVLIIGAGQSGLQVAARLQQMRIPTILVEKDERIGDVWRRRYSSLMLHTPKSHHNLLYQPFPANWPEWTPGHKLADWMEQYAISQDLLVWTKTRVVPPPSYNWETGKWTVTVDKQGEIVTVYPKHLIVATGFLGAPYMPTFNGQEEFQGQILHSNKFSSGAEFAGKRCVVIGTGNSGADIALDLSTRGAASVLIVQRSSTCVQPATTVVEQLYHAYPEDVPVEVSDFKSHATPIKRLFEILSQTRHLYWDREKELIEGLRNTGMQVDMGPNNTGVLGLVYSRYAGVWVDIGCGEKIISGQIQVKSGVLIQKFTNNSVVFEDGSSVEADVVILATGYQNMNESLRALLGNEVVNQTPSVPTTPLDEEGELSAGYRPTGHPGLWFAPGSFPDSRLCSKYLGIQIQAMKLGYL